MIETETEKHMANEMGKGAHTDTFMCIYIYIMFGFWLELDWSNVKK